MRVIWLQDPSSAIKQNIILPEGLYNKKEKKIRCSVSVIPLYTTLTNRASEAQERNFIVLLI